MCQARLRFLRQGPSCEGIDDFDEPDVGPGGDETRTISEALVWVLGVGYVDKGTGGVYEPMTDGTQNITHKVISCPDSYLPTLKYKSLGSRSEYYHVIEVCTPYRARITMLMKYHEWWLERGACRGGSLDRLGSLVGCQG